MNKIRLIFSILKLKHWIKNLVVFIPLIFSLSFTDEKLFLYSLGAFFSFCFISAAVYVFNDICDIEKDRLHPSKKNRPLASGEISVKVAWLLFGVLVVVSFLMAVLLNKFVLIAEFLYLLLNIFYSKNLKKIPIIDVVCIALGFILRILAGCGAIMVVPSPLVILLTFFTSMFFTFSKRKMEYVLLSDKNVCRKSINEYNENLLNQYVAINAVLSIAFYFTYMLDRTTMDRAGTDFLYLTAIPFTIIIFRLLCIFSTNKNNDDPAECLYKDKILLWLVVIYFATLFSVLFFKI